MGKMKKCTVCGSDIASSAATCPNCGAKNKKPLFLRGWFIVLAAVIVAFSVIGITRSANASTITFSNNEEFSAREVKKMSNTSLYLGQPCRVIMKVKRVSSDFMNIDSSDGVEVDYTYASNEEKAMIAALKKGDWIEARGTLRFAGTWQVCINNTTQITLFE